MSAARETIFGKKSRLGAFAALLCMGLMLPAYGNCAEKILTSYTWDRELDVAVSDEAAMPNANQVVLTATGGAIRNILKPPPPGPKPPIDEEDYYDSRCGWTPSTIFQNLTMTNDPEGTGCQVGQQIVPLLTSATRPLREAWSLYGAVSYDLQVKLNWFFDLAYAASGVNIRWRESSTPGKYEGYGISFLYFKNQLTCTSSTRDYIPHSIKPGSGSSLRNQLLLVLWQQKVVSGVERRNWLAYAVMDDPKVQGGQVYVRVGLVWVRLDSPSMTDNVTLLVRVEDKRIGGERYSDIKIYYGDASNNSSRTSGTRGKDAYAANIYRDAYPPDCATSLFPSWPSNIFEPLSAADQTACYWSYPKWHASLPYLTNKYVIPVSRVASDGLPHSYRSTQAGTTNSIQPTWPVNSSATVTDGTVVWRENGTARPTKYDYFTMLSANPQGSSNRVQMIVNPALVNDVLTNANPSATVALQEDRATLRTSDFTLATYPATSPEIGLHGMGYLTGGDYWWFQYVNRGVSFTDMAVQILGKSE